MLSTYRVIKKYNRRTKSFYFVEDKISKSFQLTDFSTIDTASLLRDYYARIDKYYSRSPSRSRGIRTNSVIPILWYDDIRKYIGRLRKWFFKEYGETIRYYIICEYGSQSFRPHYHILLFHDSPRARADFRIVRTLPQSTKENPQSTFYPLSDGPSIQSHWITMTYFRICSTCGSRSQARFCHCTISTISDRT